MIVGGQLPEFAGKTHLLRDSKINFPYAEIGYDASEPVCTIRLSR